MNQWRCGDIYDATQMEFIGNPILGERSYQRNESKSGEDFSIHFNDV